MVDIEDGQVQQKRRLKEWTNIKVLSPVINQQLLWAQTKSRALAEVEGDFLMEAYPILDEDGHMINKWSLWAKIEFRALAKVEGDILMEAYPILDEDGHLINKWLLWAKTESRALAKVKGDILLEAYSTFR
ncbi:MAG: hypothetical protein M1812_004884 [Candelaria pacifica]|nr:MAG: hypothetical protein M1812_004884 [Candelaria pacifica]